MEGITDKIVGIPNEIIYNILLFVPREGKNWLHCKLVSKEFERVAYGVFEPTQDAGDLGFELLNRYDDDIVWSIWNGKIESVRFLLYHPKSVILGAYLSEAIRAAQVFSKNIYLHLIHIKSTQMDIFKDILNYPGIDINDELYNPLLTCIKYEQSLCGLELVKDPRLIANESNKNILKIMCIESYVNGSYMFDIPHMATLACELIKTRQFAPTIKSNTLLTHSIANDQKEIFSLLIKDDRINPSIPNNRALHMAIRYERGHMVDDLLKDNRVVEALNPKAIELNVRCTDQSIVQKLVAIKPKILYHAISDACMNSEIDLIRIIDLLQHPSFDASQFEYSAVTFAAQNQRKDIIDLFLSDKRLDVCGQQKVVDNLLYMDDITCAEKLLNHPSFRPEIVTPGIINRLCVAGKIESLMLIVRQKNIDLKVEGPRVVCTFLELNGIIATVDTTVEFIQELFHYPSIHIGDTINRFLRFFGRRMDAANILECLSRPCVNPFLLIAELLCWVVEEPCDNDLGQVLVKMARDFPVQTRKMVTRLRTRPTWMEYMVTDSPFDQMRVSRLKKRQHTIVDGIEASPKKPRFDPF